MNEDNTIIRTNTYTQSQNTIIFGQMDNSSTSSDDNTVFAKEFLTLLDKISPSQDITRQLKIDK